MPTVLRVVSEGNVAERSSIVRSAVSPVPRCRYGPRRATGLAPICLACTHAVAWRKGAPAARSNALPWSVGRSLESASDAYVLPRSCILRERQARKTRRRAYIVCRGACSCICIDRSWVYVYSPESRPPPPLARAQSGAPPRTLSCFGSATSART